MASSVPSLSGAAEVANAATARRSGAAMLVQASRPIAGYDAARHRAMLAGEGRHHLDGGSRRIMLEIER